MKYQAASQYHCRVEFKKSIESDDGYSTPSFEHDFFRWVSIEIKGSGEKEQSGQHQSETLYLIKTRYTDQITQAHQLHYQGVSYEVIGEPINVNFQNIETHLTAKVLSDAGKYRR